VIPVAQTQRYEGPEQRGSCVQACVASVFEIPESMAPTQGEIFVWTRLHYPGLTCLHRETDRPVKEPPVPQAGEQTIWIATVHTQTPAFTDPCGRCWEYEGNEHGPPLPGRPRRCPWCGERWGLEKGVRRGYHAVVMRGRDVVWDPNPDWYVGARHWLVRDPARVEPRRLPRA
jgi:hypothetical protein